MFGHSFFLGKQMDHETKFHKKVYRKLDTSPLAGSIKPAPSHSTKNGASQKNIAPTHAISGLREEFKKTFLPLLIDIFELRQMIENHKAQREMPLLPMEKLSKSPQEILDRLEKLQKEIEESQRWCDGVILQISKGIEDAKETLKIFNQTEPLEEKKNSLLKRLFKFKK